MHNTVCAFTFIALAMVSTSAYAGDAKTPGTIILSVPHQNFFASGPVTFNPNPVKTVTPTGEILCSSYCSIGSTMTNAGPGAHPPSIHPR